MPPVPVHIDDPIVPTKAHGATEADPAAVTGVIASNSSTTTQGVASPYTPARPGAAAAAPAPTPYIPRPVPEPTRTQPQATPDGPPPPQPGAVPVPPSYYRASASATQPLPPPPKAGEAVPQRQVAMPSQMQVPPPTQNYAPTHSTAAAATVPVAQQAGGPTTLNFGLVSHEPQSGSAAGYQQNTYAQDMTPAQRRSLDAHERSEGIVNNLGGEKAGETAENMWNAVKNWASVAGEKLVETEENVWKKINGR